MTAENFEAALAAVLEAEGGNDDDPADHGGRTSHGITQAEYDAWRREQGAPEQDVWKISPSEIHQIYHDEYWEPWCDMLPKGLDFLYFDLAVNAGPHEATLVLQRAVGVAADGRIGPRTREAIRAADPAGAISRFTKYKRAFYLSLHQPRFIHGWLNRADAAQATAMAMAKGEA